MDQQSEITSTAELESRLGEIKLPLEEIVPEGVRDWLDAFAGSNGTTSELLLCSALVSTSALVGHSTLAHMKKKLIYFSSLRHLPERERHQLATRAALSL